MTGAEGTGRVEELLRRELTPERYELVLPADEVMARVRHRLDRTRLWRQGGAALGVAVVAAAIVVAVVVTLRPDRGPVVPGGTAAPTGASASPTAGASAPASTAPLTVGGVPAGLVPVADVAAATRFPPALAVVPRGGRQVAYVSFDDANRVWRIVVAADADDVPGLPGTPVPVPAEWGMGGQLLLSDDGDTLYVKAWQPDGHRWFLAVTGGGLTNRLEVAGQVAKRTFTGI